MIFKCQTTNIQNLRSQYSIRQLIKQINNTGLSLILVEQNVIQSLAIADRAYVIEEGSVTLSGSAAELRENSDLKKSYLGL